MCYNFSVFFFCLIQTASVEDSSMEISLTEEGEIAPVEDYMEPIWFREIQQEDKGNLTDDDGLG